MLSSGTGYFDLGFDRDMSGNYLCMGRICRGVAKIFQRGGEVGSHCVKHYRNGVFTTEYCRLFALKWLTKGGSRAPQDPPRYALGDEVTGHHELDSR